MIFKVCLKNNWYAAKRSCSCTECLELETLTKGNLDYYYPENINYLQALSREIHDMQHSQAKELICCCMLQYAAVCCSMLQYAAVCCTFFYSPKISHKALSPPQDQISSKSNLCFRIFKVCSKNDRCAANCSCSYINF